MSADRHSGPERHFYDPFWPGISEVEEFDPEPGPFVVEGKTYTYYQATQKQRYMEREIRALKREVNAGGDKAVLGSLIRQKTREYRAFSDAVNIRPKLERLRVLGYDRSTAASVKNAMRFIDDIRKAGNVPQTARINLVPRWIDVGALSFDDKHINGDRSHHVTREQAEGWIKKAKFSISVWGGNYERYHGEEGSVYVNLVTKNIRTAYASDEYDKHVIAMLEVLKQNGY